MALNIPFKATSHKPMRAAFDKHMSDFVRNIRGRKLNVTSFTDEPNLIIGKMGSGRGQHLEKALQNGMCKP